MPGRKSGSVLPNQRQASAETVAAMSDQKTKVARRAATGFTFFSLDYCDATVLERPRLGPSYGAGVLAATVGCRGDPADEGPQEPVLDAGVEGGL